MSHESASATTVLLRAFTALSPEQLENLRFHIQRETPICCGPLAYWFVHEASGSAAPEVLANCQAIRLQKRRINGVLFDVIEQDWQDTYVALVRAGGDLKPCDANSHLGATSGYTAALCKASDDEVREAMREASYGRRR